MCGGYAAEPEDPGHPLAPLPVDTFDEPDEAERLAALRARADCRTVARELWAEMHATLRGRQRICAPNIPRELTAWEDLCLQFGLDDARLVAAACRTFPLGQFPFERAGMAGLLSANGFAALATFGRNLRARPQTAPPRAVAPAELLRPHALGEVDTYHAGP